MTTPAERMADMAKALAAEADVTPEQALEGLRQALVGEREPISRLHPALEEIRRVRSIDWPRQGFLADRAEEIHKCAACCEDVTLDQGYSVGSTEAGWWFTCGKHNGQAPHELWQDIEWRFLSSATADMVEQRRPCP